LVIFTLMYPDHIVKINEKIILQLHMIIIEKLRHNKTKIITKLL
jgi:hypothetical protein